MSFSAIMGLGQTALELGLLNALVVLALFLSYSMLNVCDLSTDGCFTLGAAVGVSVIYYLRDSGIPVEVVAFISLPASLLAGMTSGFVTAFLQTRMGVDSLLSGIVVNTGLYSVNMAIMHTKTPLNINLKYTTVFTMLKSALANTPLKGMETLFIALLAVALIVLFLSVFLHTKLGLSIRATGNNPDMVRSSSINPIMTTTWGLTISNSFTALAGCLFAQSQKQAEINVGSGMLTVALASLLIGNVLFGRFSITVRAIGAVVGAFIFRLVYTIALRFDMPTFMLKAISSIIVILAMFIPYLIKQYPNLIRRFLAGKKVQ